MVAFGCRHRKMRGARGIFGYSEIRVMERKGRLDVEGDKERRGKQREETETRRGDGERGEGGGCDQAKRDENEREQENIT
jgi:hypothetical protein